MWTEEGEKEKSKGCKSGEQLLSWLQLPRGRSLAFLEVGWGWDWGDWQDAVFLFLVRIDHAGKGVVGETGMKSHKRKGRRFLHAGEAGYSRCKAHRK